MHLPAEHVLSAGIKGQQTKDERERQDILVKHKACLMCQITKLDQKTKEGNSASQKR